MSIDDAPATILVVEDDASTRTFLADNLTADAMREASPNAKHEPLELRPAAHTPSA
jgi:DNA-binding response OmpR family regulator